METSRVQAPGESDAPRARGVVVHGTVEPGWEAVLTEPALAFVGDLARSFTDRIEGLLARRSVLQAEYDQGRLPDFQESGKEVRAGDWTCAEIPADLRDRRVEITGPVDRKMIINALNSGANVFMADFEDSNAPTWHNAVQGQLDLRDAVRGTIELIDEARGKHYRLNERPAVLMVRPRGLHLTEAHVTVDGRAVPGSLFDFGLFFFHNARALVAKGSGPYFYLPKLQGRTEARLWNDVFVAAQRALGLPRGTVRATVLIETLPAAFEMDEILYELREHAAGLNCGRWDYIFSFIKTTRAHPRFVMPDRGRVGMTQRCMRSYSRLLIKTCHRRGVHGMGGMAAQIPIKNDPAANEAALQKVRDDKLREVHDGHDGTWVAHPGLVGIARDIFDRAMRTPNQIDRKLEDVVVTREDLLAVPHGTRTEAGLRQNCSVSVQYLAAWLRGSGCVPIDHLMEDAATAEISRTQLWQWVRHGAALEDGRTIDADLVRRTLDEELERLADGLSAAELAESRLEDARRLFEAVSLADELADFLTLPAYDLLTADTRPTA